MVKPGYYWLAAKWQNLLPSCIDCNRARRHSYPDGAALSGKANWFPLLDESKRALASGEKRGEEPYLLDPCKDDPDLHFEFIEEGGLVAAAWDGPPSGRGEKTIEILGLQRPRLAEARRSHSVVVERAIGHFQRAVQRLEQDPDDEDAIDDLAFEMEELERLRDSSAPYAGMARQRIDPVLRSFIPPKARRSHGR